MNVIDIENGKEILYSQSPEKNNLSEIWINPVWKLTPHTFYKSLLDTEGPGEATEYTIHCLRKANGALDGIYWINDLLDRWVVFKKVQDIIDDPDLSDKQKLDTLNDIYNRHYQDLRTLSLSKTSIRE